MDVLDPADIVRLVEKDANVQRLQSVGICMSASMSTRICMNVDICMSIRTKTKAQYQYIKKNVSLTLVEKHADVQRLQVVSIRISTSTSISIST